MTTSPPPSDNGPPPPLFTLGSALRWLSHDCSCGDPIATMTASVWFIRHGQQRRMSPLESLVIVEPTAMDERNCDLRQLIQDVNCCTGGSIRIRQRGRGNDVHPLLAVACGYPAGQKRDSKEADIWGLRETPPDTIGLEQLVLHAFTRWNRNRGASR